MSLSEVIKNGTMRFKRTTSGRRIHLGYSGANAVNCSHDGQRRNSHWMAISINEAMRYSDECFCQKCFPNGKPVINSEEQQ